MDIEKIWEYCSSMNGASESFPFDTKTLVFKVGGKIFALMSVENFKSINLKCNPEKAIELREQFTGIIPGYHMNKKHWNTVLINDDVTDKHLFELIHQSYQLVFNVLPKKIKDGISIG